MAIAIGTNNSTATPKDAVESFCSFRSKSLKELLVNKSIPRLEKANVEVDQYMFNCHLGAMTENYTDAAS